jgi:hypothetical protein
MPTITCARPLTMIVEPIARGFDPSARRQRLSLITAAGVAVASISAAVRPRPVAVRIPSTSKYVAVTRATRTRCTSAPTRSGAIMEESRAASAANTSVSAVIETKSSYDVSP